MEYKIMNDYTRGRQKYRTEFSIKSLSETGEFAGYASIFNVVDRDNDIITAGAFKRTLKNRNIKHDVKLLWQHIPTEPIGFFESIREDMAGLYVTGKILLNLEKGREVYSLMKSGAVSGLSIGYSVKKSSFNPVKNVRVIKEVDLWEISVVTFPANQHAAITSVKSNSAANSASSSCNTDAAQLEELDQALQYATGVLYG